MLFQRTVLAASLACMLAAPALAAPKEEFNFSWSARQKFAWAQANYSAFCSIPKSRNVKFESLPGWMQEGLGWANEGMVVSGIRESCGKDLTADTAAAYKPQ